MINLLKYVFIYQIKLIPNTISFTFLLSAARANTMDPLLYKNKYYIHIYIDIYIFI